MSAEIRNQRHNPERTSTRRSIEKVYGFENPFKPDPLTRKAARFLRKPGCMLEVGCGEGADSVFFARRGWTVRSFDKNADQLRRFRRFRRDHRLSKITILNSDALRHRFEPNRFDAVLCILVLCCMKRSEFEALLGPLRNSVKLGGFIVASARNYLDPEFKKFRTSERMIERNTFKDPDECCRFLYFFEKDQMRRSFPDFEILHYREGHGPCKYGEHQFHGDSEIICRRVK
ncbi:MAG TPA: class I SAM-dependent methyltransferase [Bacteroidota bacterium]|nr:class I SAM-dependent methyltransferase [Bacteroidota bacterium]